MRIHSLTALFAVAALCAQTQNIVYHDDPSPTTGPANAFPFGSAGTRIQQLIPQSVLGSTPAMIQDLFVNPQLTSIQTSITESQVYYGDFEIQMGITQATTLTTTWATNSPSPTTVYRGPLLVKFVRDQWVPLGLPASYLWLPLTPADNLVIDFICWQVIDTGAVPPDVNGYFLNVHSSPGRTIPRAYRRGWATGQLPTAAGADGNGIKLGILFNDGNFVAHDGDCAGSSTQVPMIGTAPGTWPTLGSPLDIRIAQGPPNLVAGLVLGFDTTTYLGVSLPYEMTPVGAPGCTFWHSNDGIPAFVPLDASGNGSFSIALPANPAFATARFYATWICIDPTANALGLVPSGFATVIL